jgi:hypothetical protein
MWTTLVWRARLDCEVAASIVLNDFSREKPSTRTRWAKSTKKLLVRDAWSCGAVNATRSLKAILKK